MTLPVSGTISVQDINTEFSLGNSLSAYRGVTWYTDTSGQTGTFSSTNLDFAEFYGKRKTAPFNPTWSGNSVYYLDNGFYTSGSTFYFRGNGTNGTFLSASTSGTFTDGTSNVASIGSEDLGGVRGFGNNQLQSRSGTSSIGGSSNISYTIGSGFSGSSIFNAGSFNAGFETSGGTMRCRNGNRTGAYISLTG